MNGKSLLPLSLEGWCDLSTGAIELSRRSQRMPHDDVFERGRGGAATLGRIRDRRQEAGVKVASPAQFAFERWTDRGDVFLDEVSGEFLVALWDASSRCALLAVDRFSSLPMFWATKGTRLGFSPKPAEAARLAGITLEVDWQSVFAYVYFHMIPAPLSVFAGVRRLDMGEALRIAKGSIEPFRYWCPVFDEARPFEFATEREAFLSALREGVAECTAGLSRDEIGCFLSGGTDSSTIAGLVTRHFEAPAKTFSIGFDVGGYDESMYSRLAAKHFATEHTEYYLTADDVLRGVEQIATQYEQPFGNSSAVPTFFCARLAQETGVTRMLGGDGGDELYGGNERYAKQAVFARYASTPALLRKSLLEPLLFGPLGDLDWSLLPKARSYVEQANEPLPDRLQSRYNLVNQLGAGEIFTEAMLGRVDLARPLALEREVWARGHARSMPMKQINQLLAWDFKFTLADSDLPKVTRMCHAAGIEVAFPMLTQTLVEHSLRLAPGEKLKGQRLRHFFKESLRGFLPNEIIAKKKQGFGVPFGAWLLGHEQLQAKANDALRSLSDRGVIREEFVATLLEHLRTSHAGYYGTMVWVLMILELWLRESPLADERIA